MSSNQRLIFSILEFLNSECESRMEDEREGLEVVIECLERVYNVSLTNSSDVSKFHVDKPLTEIFESATKMTTRPFPTDEDKDRAEELKTQGNNLMKEGKYENAIDCYDQAVKLDWTNAVYLCNRAAACSKLGKHEEAVKNCKEALELDPKYGKAYGRMGTAYMALEKYQEARDSFAKAKELDPDNDLYITNLKTAEDKLREAQERSSSASQGTGGGPANLMNSLFSNPGIMNMASQFMANPQMQQMMTNMMSGFGGMTGDDQSAGQQPPSQQPPSQQPPSQQPPSQQPPSQQPPSQQPPSQQPPSQQPPSQQPPSQQPPSQPAEGQPDSEGTTTPESNTGTEGTNPEAGLGAGGYSNIFQFATQMAQQLEQSNPELVNNLRQSMQNVTGENTGPNQNTDDTSQNEKE